MAKRGRKSIDAMMIPNVQGAPSRITAPSTLRPNEKKLFNEIVRACAPNHFRVSDTYMLSSFVTATLLSRSTANKPKQFAIFEKSTRLQAALATKLRLTPQTRLDPKGVHRDGAGQSNNTPKPWDDNGENNGDDDADAA